ncbi:Prefoldin subunit 2 [Balamuthia mandrillaris]
MQAQPSLTGGSLEQQQIAKQYQQMRAECREIAQKITELESERNEHRLVVKAISDLNAERRCYRLIGGVLVERTVGEVLPAVKANLEGIEQLLKQLTDALEQKDKEMIAFKTEHKIRVMGEDEDEDEEQGKKDKEGGSSSAAGNQQQKASSGVLV